MKAAQPSILGASAGLSAVDWLAAEVNKLLEAGFGVSVGLLNSDWFPADEKSWQGGPPKIRSGAIFAIAGASFIPVAGGNVGHYIAVALAAQPNTTVYALTRDASTKFPEGVVAKQVDYTSEDGLAAGRGQDHQTG